MDSTTTTASEYEAQRAQRIAENRQRLQTLEINVLSTKVGGRKGGSKLRTASAGLIDATAAGGGCSQHQSTNKSTNKSCPPVKRRFKKPRSAATEPVKKSRRLRGQSAETSTEIAEELREEISQAGKKSRALDIGDDGGVPSVVEAPFTLISIGITVLDVGHIHRGAWAHRYWSSGGARYHHAYPVGYRATKHQYGSEYLMEIKAGDFGPVFEGEPAPSVNPNAVELAARDFMTLDGVGELGAIAIASTVSLGGSSHPSVESLAKWVRSKEENRTTLLEFLLYNRFLMPLQ